MASPILLVRAAAVLADERARKGVGWALAAVMAPLTVLAALVLCLAAGTSSHNNSAVDLCFGSGPIPESVPEEYRAHITAMRAEFALLDSAMDELSGQMENGDRLDANRVKAVFYTLYFGAGRPDEAARRRFLECFAAYEQHTRTVQIEDENGGTVESEETYTAAKPVSLEDAYANLSALLGREITAEERSNVDHMCLLLSTPSGTGSGSGGGQRGDGSSTALSTAGFTDPATKNARDLVVYANHAWRSGWGYVWGSFGNVLTESDLQWMMRQYPEMVGGYEGMIRTKWLGGRTTDCVGLIKGYGWLDPASLRIRYGTNGMPDITANQMYHAASVSGPIDTMPDIPGLAVWKKGHIGVYVGNGEVIEARSTSLGVVKTQLAGRGWTHWLMIEYINYE